MLVLSRKPKQSLRISKDITVTVLEVNGNQVRIGIEAPQQIPIVRSEIDRRVVNAPRGGEHECAETCHAIGNP